MEAEATLQSAQTRLQRIEQMHKAGQVSATEFAAARVAAHAAAIELQRHKGGDNQRSRAEADLRLAELNLQATQEEFDRATARAKTNSISREEVDALELAFRRAQIAVQRAKLRLEATPKQ